MSALVTGEPDSVEPPMRRLTITTISGIMIAIVVAAVFAVIGLLRGGGSDDWMASGSVVMEEETGALYVNIDGALFPTLNYASAVLATGATDAVEVSTVSRSDLSSIERGQLIGIPGLPASMPAPDELVRGPITVCSRAVAEGIDVRAVVDVEVGATAPQQLAPDDALYVESFDNERFLLYQGQRLPVASSVEAALQIDEEPVRVGSAFMTAIPTGASFDTPRIPGQGRPVAGVSALVGQVIEVDDGTFRVAVADGVARISDVQAKLLRTAKLAGQRRDPIAMSLSEVLDLPETPAADAGLDDVMGGLPEVLPNLSTDARSAGGACAAFVEDQPLPLLAVPAAQDNVGEPTSESDASRLGRADELSIEPGAGLLAGTAGARTVYFVGEPGRVYPAANAATLGGFGYGAVEPVTLPAELLEVLPLGEALDPARARTSAF